WGRVQGAFGELLIGGADTAMNEYGGVGIVTPALPLNYFDSDISAVPGGGVGFMGKDDALSIRLGNRNIGLGAAGTLKAGVSYQPNADTDGSDDTNYGFASRGPGLAPKDQIALGASWKAPKGAPFRAEIGGGYLTADGPGAEDLYHAGIELGFGGFDVAALYELEDGAGPDTDFYGLGAQYGTGPWTVGGGVLFSEGGEERTVATFGASYALAPGVTAAAAAEYGDLAGDGRDSGYGAAATLHIKF
ncbi:MAG: porin, partial [Pseudomonadota bacterium]